MTSARFAHGRATTARIDRKRDRDLQGNRRAAALLGNLPGALRITPAEEKQMLASLSEIAQDSKALLALTRDSTRKRGEADEKAYGQLVNIAHKR